jgi:hypothetical protein
MHSSPIEPGRGYPDLAVSSEATTAASWDRPASMAANGTEEKIA